MGTQARRTVFVFDGNMRHMVDLPVGDRGELAAEFDSGQFFRGRSGEPVLGPGRYRRAGEFNGIPRFNRVSPG